MKYCPWVSWLKNTEGEKRACTVILLSLETWEDEGCPGKAAQEAASSLSVCAGCAASIWGDRGCSQPSAVGSCPNSSWACRALHAQKFLPSKRCGYRETAPTTVSCLCSSCFCASCFTLTSTFQLLQKQDLQSWCFLRLCQFEFKEQ